LAALSACGADDVREPPDSPARAREQVLATLQRSLGPIALTLHPELGTPIGVEFQRPPQLVNTSGLGSAVRELILRFRPLYGMQPGDTLELKETQADAQGSRHLRFAVERGGQPIWESQLVAHLSPTGGVLRLHGQVPWLAGRATASPTPTFTAEAAKQQALFAARFGEGGAASLSARSPSLHYLRVDGALRLAWRVEISGQEADRPRREAIFVDAQLGQVLRREEQIARIDVTLPAQGQGIGAQGTRYRLDIAQRGERYLLHDPTRGDQRVTAASPGDRLPGRTVESLDPQRWESHSPSSTRGQSVDVHAHLQSLWDYFASQHQIFGWDGKGRGIVAITHFRESMPGPGNPAVPSLGLPWALFDGERLFFADGDGRTLSPLGAALDVVAHEYSHAVLRSQASLAQVGESAALDEGLANLLACLIEQHLRPQKGNFTVGEEVFIAPPPGDPGPRPGVFSDLGQPARSGQVAHLRDRVEGSEPGAIHRNAGLVGHMGYRLAQALGGGKTAAIVVRAAQHYLVPAAGFVEAALAMRWAARDLYGTPGEQAVRDAWSAVGVSAEPDPVRPLGLK
jgi:Zn-dependent metalloprotease